MDAQWIQFDLSVVKLYEYVLLERSAENLFAQVVYSGESYDVHVFFSKLTEMFFTSDSEAVGYLRKSAIILSRA